MLARLCEGSCELVTTALKSLKIDRVDLVPEGANSAAFVTLFKGKEMNPMELEEILAKMKPEHASVITTKLETLEKEKADADSKAEEATQKANDAKAEADKAKFECDKAKAERDEAKAELDKADTKREGTASFDEDETLSKSLESADPMIRDYIARVTKQKEAAEAVAKEAIAKEKHAEAESKADELKALPIEKSKLVEFIEKSDDDTVDMLSAIAKGIEGTVLSEVGKGAESTPFSGTSDAAWSKIEKAAGDVAKERNVSKEAAVGIVIDEQPDLYREYLKGGAN